MRFNSFASRAGLILKGNGRRGQRRGLLDKASKAALLPEEKKLFAQAKAGS